MFENDRWDAQVAADYSGEYTEVNDAVGGLSQIGGSDHLGHGVRAYKVNDAFSVSLEGRNLADEYYFANLGRPDILAGFETWGRTVIASVSVKF